MYIRKNLPMPECDSCTEFILDVNEQVIFHLDRCSERILTVKCKNANLCKRLKENLKKQMEGDQT